MDGYCWELLGDSCVEGSAGDGPLSGLTNQRTAHVSRLHLWNLNWGVQKKSPVETQKSHVERCQVKSRWNCVMEKPQ